MYDDESSDFEEEDDDDEDSDDLKEPVKPISAYALFFEETQELIKSQAESFVEISKIIASMWDSLEESGKQVYRNKTEQAKQRYIIDLSDYRAKVAARRQQQQQQNNASSTDESDEEDDEPLSNLMHKNDTTHTRVQPKIIPAMPKLKVAPGIKLKPSPSSQTVIPTRIILDNQQISSSPKQPIQLRDMVPKHGQGSINLSPITFIQTKGCQAIKVIPSVSQNGSFDGGRQPILQTLAQENKIKSDSETITIDDDEMIETDLRLLCKRDGCQKRSIDDMYWDEGFCSSYCVAAHVRETFQKFLKSRVVSDIIST